jgi:murein DD-endopeptidase MepM/ murein hydrolase activator NlpD
VIRAGVIALAALLGPLCAVELSTGKAIDDAGCAILSPASVFQLGDRDVFARVAIRTYHPSERVTVQWLDPAGSVEQQISYPDLPSSRRLCLVSRLSVAGFPPASKPGLWRVETLLNGKVAALKTFHIAQTPHSGGASINSIIRREGMGGRTVLDLEGSSFAPGSVVHVARFTEAESWQYVALELPFDQSPTRLSVEIRNLEPGEYIAILRANDGSVSRPARFVVESGGGYNLPVPAGEQWVVTQGPYGSFSHWNRSLHAWDIAPRGAGYVVAMRSGVASTHDLGLHQTPYQHSFGNYITIDHGDGEYSHYAHLATGSFLVHDGDHVELGQPLAAVGNSGYTLGAGGGYHVHVHVTRSSPISAQSVPFQFGATAPRQATPVAQHPESVQVAEWWNRGLTVPPRTAALSIQVRAEKTSDALDLHVTAPDGRSYGPDPQEIRVADPQPGEWLISVEGMRGGMEPIEFQVHSRLEKQKPRTR